MNLAGLGCQTYLAGFLGRRHGEDGACRHPRRCAGEYARRREQLSSTISKTRIVGRVQQLLRLDKTIESQADRPEAEDQRLMEAATELTSKMSAVILSDYAKGALTPHLCEAVIRAAGLQAAGVCPIPRHRTSASTRGATSVCPNLAELAAATGLRHTRRKL